MSNIASFGSIRIGAERASGAGSIRLALFVMAALLSGMPFHFFMTALQGFLNLCSSFLPCFARLVIQFCACGFSFFLQQLFGLEALPFRIAERFMISALPMPMLRPLSGIANPLGARPVPCPGCIPLECLR